ncbi:hypothetical protein EON79_04195 [bacterium]|nr:MAG: hypothetical protein EON79_04195 [bacterium]
MADPQDFRDVAVVLLREAFEGRAEGNDYTWFVEGKEGIFDALASVDAETASRRPFPKSPSLAAHAYHVLYLLTWANNWHGGPEPEGDWEASWTKQKATPHEWASLREKIRTQYESFIAWFSTNQDWSPEQIRLSTLANLPHVAYHLGAMRQIIHQTKR